MMGGGERRDGGGNTAAWDGQYTGERERRTAARARPPVLAGAPHATPLAPDIMAHRVVASRSGLARRRDRQSTKPRPVRRARGRRQGRKCRGEGKGGGCAGLTLPTLPLAAAPMAPRLCSTSHRRGRWRGRLDAPGRQCCSGRGGDGAACASHRSRVCHRHELRTNLRLLVVAGTGGGACVGS